MKMTRDARRRAEAYLAEAARKLEAALYAWEFRGAPSAPILAALAGYQNPDGGFGRALEPDLRIPESSVLATTVALQTLGGLGAGPDEPLVRGAMAYLVGAYAPDRGAWPIIPPHDNSVAQAPWWGYDEDLASRWGGFLANPSAEVIAYLYTYPDLAPAGMTDAVADRLLRHLEDQGEALGMHDLMCWARLVQTPTVPEAVRSRALDRLRPLVAAGVDRDRSDWAGYGLQPLMIVSGPESPLAADLAPAVEANLDYLIETQGPDGSWTPNWSWAEIHPEAWAEAQRAWAGVLTLRHLRILRAFGRLET